MRRAAVLFVGTALSPARPSPLLRPFQPNFYQNICNMNTNINFVTSSRRCYAEAPKFSLPEIERGIKFAKEGLCLHPLESFLPSLVEYLF